MGLCGSHIVHYSMPTMPTIKPSLRRKWKRDGVYNQKMETIRNKVLQAQTLYKARKDTIHF